MVFKIYKARSFVLVRIILVAITDRPQNFDGSAQNNFIACSCNSPMFCVMISVRDLDQKMLYYLQDMVSMVSPEPLPVASFRREKEIEECRFLLVMSPCIPLAIIQSDGHTLCKKAQKIWCSCVPRKKRKTHILISLQHSLA